MQRRVGHGSLVMTQPDPLQDFPDPTLPDPEHVTGFVTRPDQIEIGH